MLACYAKAWERDVGQSIFSSAEGPFALGVSAPRKSAPSWRSRSAPPDLVHDIADLEQAGEGDISVFCIARHARGFRQQPCQRHRHQQRS